MLWYLAAGLLIWFSFSPLFGLIVGTRRRVGGFFQPPSTSRLLSGDPIPANMLFFFRPPDGYGEILYAESTLTTGENSRIGPRAIQMALFGALAFFAGSYLVTWGELSESPWRFLLFILPPAGGVAFGWSNVKLNSCFYVCERGIIEGLAFPPGNLLMKKPAVAIAYPCDGVMKVESDTNGGTSLSWFDSDGQLVGKLVKNRFQSQPIQEFAAAAQKGWYFSQLAWALHMLPRTLDFVRSSGMGIMPEGVEFSAAHLAITKDGMRYVFDLSDTEHPKLIEWPLPEYLSYAALSVFSAKGLHRDPTVLFELREH